MYGMWCHVISKCTKYNAQVIVHYLYKAATRNLFAFKMQHVI